MAVDGWKLLDTLHVSLAPREEEVAGWKLLDTKTITLVPSEEEIGGWELLDTLEITLTPPGAPPACTPGATKCVGYDFYTCNAEGQWELTEHNSSECGYAPPEEGKFPWMWAAAGGLGLAGLVLLTSGKKAKAKPKSST